MLSNELITAILFMQTLLFFFVMFLSQAIRASMSLILLFFLLSNYTFFNLLDIIDYIQNYLMDSKHIKLYCNIAEQTAIMFEIRLFFASNLIKVIKKDQRWQNKK